MVYLRNFSFVPRNADERFEPPETCYGSIYPFRLFPSIGLETIEFDPLTILYGGNGSGKTTALNVIAETIHLPRRSRFNASPFFDTYVSWCRADVSALPPDSRILVSDDVFDDLLDIRAANEGIDQEREKLFQQWQAVRKKGRASYHRFINLDTFEKWKEESEILKKNTTKSMFVNKRLPINLESGSNGESGFRFFVESLKPDNLYLLDEPENSLSAAWQMKLATVIEGMARFESCQFVIATHSPFLLAMKGAKILDFDSEGAPVRKWTELENVRRYHDFFASHEKEFAQG